ncbi:embryo defective 2170 [Striga hermonthica]|uniref:Embryo defective 2170 n=1 Tax=Striga hermonthica TaxID=68872 RepID=A0A9N7MQH3_STRHE|nr:embryo defective 2170 [Striga hermonthica]
MLDPRTQHDHKSSTIKKSAKKITHLPQFQNNRNCTYQSSSDEILQFRPNNHQELNSSSDCSPLLWKINPSPNPSPGWCPSPGPPRNSRRKAIANGQRELMEMVKNMPESSYKLSLRDLVEHHRNIVEISNIRGPQVQNMGKDRILQRKAVFMKMQGKKGFEDNRGLFLKMGFQFNSQSKRIKKIGDSNKSGGRVLPKPERDWRKKKLAAGVIVRAVELEEVVAAGAVAAGATAAGEVPVAAKEKMKEF